MGEEKRQTLELHRRYDRHDVFVLDAGHEHMFWQWGWCSCGLFFRRQISKAGDPYDWHPITCSKLLSKIAKSKGHDGIDRLHKEVLYCKRIGRK